MLRNLLSWSPTGIFCTWIKQWYVHTWHPNSTPSYYVLPTTSCQYRRKWFIVLYYTKFYLNKWVWMLSIQWMIIEFEEGIVWSKNYYSYIKCFIYFTEVLDDPLHSRQWQTLPYIIRTFCYLSDLLHVCYVYYLLCIIVRPLLN